MSARERFGAADGFSLIEMLISTLVTSLLIGGLLTLLTGAQFVHNDASGRSDAQQGARIAMSQIQRDVMGTGIGLTPMLPVFALVVPGDDGGFQLRANPNSHNVLASGDMTAMQAIPMPAGHGFLVGDTVAVYDAQGGIEVAEVETATANQIVVAPALSRNFLQADTAAVASLVQISYTLTDEAGSGVLTRQVGTQAAQIIARNVAAFTVTYFDDSLPPVAFSPVSTPEQLRIRALAITLTVQTQNERVTNGETPSFTLTARVAPRALAIVRG